MANQALSIVFMERLQRELRAKFDGSVRWKIGGKTETLCAVQTHATELLKDNGFLIQLWVDRKQNRIAFEVAKNDEQKKRREEIAESIRRHLGSLPVGVEASRGSTILRVPVRIGDNVKIDEDALVDKVVRLVEFVDKASIESVIDATLLNKLVTSARYYRSGPESEEHKRLKEYVLENPKLVGLPAKTEGEKEYPLRSGDKLDVSFKTSKEWTAVEIKSKKSPEPDIARGMFQCIKYQAVMNAECLIDRTLEVRTLLVIQRKLSPELRQLKEKLGVDVMEDIEPNQAVLGH